MVNFPCKRCIDRAPLCHSSCKKYLDAKRKNGDNKLAKQKYWTIENDFKEVRNARTKHKSK